MKRSAGKFGIHFGQLHFGIDNLLTTAAALAEVMSGLPVNTIRMATNK